MAVTGTSNTVAAASVVINATERLRLTCPPAVARVRIDPRLIVISNRIGFKAQQRRRA
jgi:hypothetical protein